MARRRRIRPANDNGGFRQRLMRARPEPSGLVMGALAWGAAMSLSAQATLWLRMAAETSHYWSLSLLCFAGGLMAWPLAIYAIRFVALDRPRDIAFAAAMIFLPVATVAVTSVVFAVIYRNFYAQWHGELFTWIWVLQLAFTTASALYQFAVIGLRLYLPLGAMFLLGAALLIASRHRPGKRKN